MSHFRKIIIASHLLLLAEISVATPAAAATFDGEWSVRIASNNSACTSGASVSIGINNGQVASNNAMMTASGRVADAGTISVTLASGVKRAVGFGRLTATSGSGTWHGGPCSGTWTAQRIYPAAKRISACARPLCPDLCGIFRVGHRLHPGRIISVQRFLHREVGHAVGRRSPMPMLFTRRNPDDIARPDLAHRFTLGLNPADA